MKTLLFITILALSGCNERPVKVKSFEEYNSLGYKCCMNGKNAHLRKGYFYCDKEVVRDDDDAFNN